MKNSNKTIWIINQYASHLVTRHEELSKSFAAHGYIVAVITSSFHHGKREYMYDEPITYRELCDGVTYVYIHSGPAYQKNDAGRIFNMLDFCRLVDRYKGEISNIIGKPGYVIASSAPPFVWEIGRRISKKYGAKFIAEFRDIWPLSLIEIQGVSPRHPLVKILSVIEKRAYRYSDLIVSTMKDAWKHVVEVSDVTRDKVKWMPNGINIKTFEESLNSPEELPVDLDDYLSSHWCCLYVGSIVKSECVDFMVNAIGKLDNNDIFFAVVGEGHEKERIQNLINEKGYTNIRMFPFLDRRLIPKALSKAGCCVAACKDVGIGKYGLSMYKLNDYLYSGKPTVFAYDYTSVVEEAGQVAVQYGSEEVFENAVKSLRYADEITIEKLAIVSKRVIAETYDFSMIGENYLDAIISC